MFKILIQENDPDILDLMLLVLEAENQKVIGLSAYEDVLPAIEDFSPHLILLDFVLTGSHCIRTCEGIKNVYPKISVIATSCNSAISKVYSLSGFDDYIEKPFNINDFWETIKKHL